LIQLITGLYLFSGDPGEYVQVAGIPQQDAFARAGTDFFTSRLSGERTAAHWIHPPSVGADRRHWSPWGFG